MFTLTLRELHSESEVTRGQRMMKAVMDIEPLIRIISDLCNTLELTKYWLPVFCPLFLSFPNSTKSSAHRVSLESTICHYCKTKHTLQHQTNAHSHMGSNKKTTDACRVFYKLV